MASRSGRTVQGTDGGDHLFRERVASQYQVSARNKSMLKVYLFGHWLLAGAQLLLLPHLSPFPPFPESGTYLEYAWLASLPFTLLALTACNKSKSGQMNVFKFAIIGLGLVPSLVMFLLVAPATLQYLQTGSDKGLVVWQGYPACLITSGLNLLSLFIHLMEIQVARTLIGAWAPRHVKRS